MDQARAKKNQCLRQGRLNPGKKGSLFAETFFAEDSAHIWSTMETCVPYVFLSFVCARARASFRIFWASSFATSKLVDKSSETLSIRSIRSLDPLLPHFLTNFFDNTHPSKVELVDKHIITLNISDTFRCIATAYQIHSISEV